MKITLRNKNSSKICVSNLMSIGAPDIVLWRFSHYFWNAPRTIYYYVSEFESDYSEIDIIATQIVNKKILQKAIIKKKIHR